jgi:hypothetical protein
MSREPANEQLLEVVLYKGNQKASHERWTVIVDLASQRGLRQARYDLDALLERLAVEANPRADPLEYHLELTNQANRSIKWRLLS